MKICKLFLYFIYTICIFSLLLSQKTAEQLLLERQIKELQENTISNDEGFYQSGIFTANFADSLKMYDLDKESELSKKDQLEYYGYDFFTSFPERLVWDNQPPAGDYVLGTGDEVIIETWGDTQLRAVHIIDQYGKINIDKIGQIHLTGTSFKDVKSKLLNKFENVYSSLKGNTPTAFLDISIGKLKSINVTFIGEAMAPGIHAIHPFSTIITALMQTGGIDKIGSLRDIQLIRNGKTERVLDFYEYLSKGNTENDVRLLDGDIIFIPVRHSTNSVKGQVMRPAIYEFFKNETLDKIIYFTGGLKVDAHNIIRIYRTESSSASANTYLVNLKSQSNFTLQNGDVIEVYQIADSEHKVYVYGQIKNPGEYAFDTQKETTLLDILKLAGGINDETFLRTMYHEVGEIIRNHPSIDYPEIINFNIEKLLAGDSNENKILQNWDIILIRQNPNYKSPKKVTLTGEVKVPGIYALQKKWETLDDILIRAGGFTSKAYQDGIQMYRNRKQVALKNFDIVLLDGDSLMVPEHPGVVKVLGAVNRSGLIQYDKKKSLSDYIENAGGYTMDADKHNITIIFANGDVRIKKRFRNLKIGEGTTIIVQYKEEEEPFNITDFSTNLASIITSVATMYLLISSQ